MPRFKFTLLAVVIFALAFSVLAQEEAPGAYPALQKGNPGALIKLEVFNDYQCPTCASFNIPLSAIAAKYPDTVLIIFRNYPLMQIHKHAYAAAHAVEAAGKQGKAFEMMDRLYERQSRWSAVGSTDRAFRNYAKKIGLDLEMFAADLESEDVKSRIDLDIARGRSLKLSGTPSIFLDGELLTFLEVGALEETIEKRLKLAADR